METRRRDLRSAPYIPNTVETPRKKYAKTNRYSETASSSRSSEPRVNSRKNPRKTNVIEYINSAKAIYRTWCLEERIIDRSAELDVLMLNGGGAGLLSEHQTNSFLVFIPIAKPSLPPSLRKRWDQLRNIVAFAGKLSDAHKSRGLAKSCVAIMGTRRGTRNIKKIGRIGHPFHNAAFPAVSIGRNTISMAETRNNEAATKMGALAVACEAFPDAGVVTILIAGARIPVIRLKEEQMASPVPRWGAGKTSGV